jgi:asparagine synthetase B (glutamine-hydrolysing)
MNENFEEFINAIYNRGSDYLRISKVNQNKLIEDYNDDIKKMKYKEVFKEIINNNSKILIDSYINLFNNNQIIEKKPYCDSNIFQFNGEIYTNKNKINNDNKNLNNDIILFNILNNFSKENKVADINNYVENFFKIYNNIESDHSFYFHDNINNQILISRDIFGKRSIILYYIKSLSILILTPVLTDTLIKLYQADIQNIYLLEIPSNHLLLINQNENLNNLKTITLYENPFMPKTHLLRFNPKSNKITSYEKLTETCHKMLIQSIKKRLNDILINTKDEKEYNLGITFSGGLDSTLTAYYSLLVTPDNINIDLFNLSFDKSSPDRITGIISYKELIDKFPNRKINLILMDREYTTDLTEEFQKNILKLIYPRKTHMDFNISSAKNISTSKKGYLVNKEKLIDYFKDLDNKIINNDLIKKCEEKEYQNNILTKKIANFEYQKFTDLSNIYTSDAKIFLDGLGADEIFGGYLRYKNGNIEEQMAKDLDRLWLRNCGRDDRVCGVNKLELRFPYLDNDLMDFLSSISDINQIVDFKKPRGEGEKFLLRNVAKTILGFNLSYKFEKRAIQFGTKIAHHTNVHKYGSNNKANGKAQFE